MKLFGAVAVHVQAEDILRQPRFFEKIRKAFGGKPDLRTGRVRASLEATAVVEATRDALRRMGVSNAISLVIDDTVLFHDRDGKADDLGDLFLAFHENDSVFGQGFRELRLAVEHHEAGLHVVLEIQARSEHPKSAPSVRVLVSGRIDALTPKPSEDAESYRKRAEPIATDPKALEVYRMQFSSFVDRVRDALAAALPQARAETEVTETRIVRPAEKQAEPPRHDQRTYDPYDHWYPYYYSPVGIMADAFMWSAMFSLMSPVHYPHYVVVDSGNHFQGHTDDPGIQSGPTAEAPAEEGGSWWEDNSSDASSDLGGDAGGDSDGGGSWWDSGDGGDSGGGFDDGGGFDGGGFDGGGFFD